MGNGRKARLKPSSRPKHSEYGVSRARQISVDAIDWSLAIRSINVDHVDRLAGAAHLPALKVWEYEPGRYRGIDGYHRWRLAKDRGVISVAAIVHRFAKGKEGERAFDFECVQSNIQHGLPLTRDERDHAIVRIWSRWGRSGARPAGVTLEKLGHLFNLTRPRVHQILAAAELDSAPQHAAQAGNNSSGPMNNLTEQPRHLSEPNDGGTQRAIGGARRYSAARPRGYSSFARFSAATQRLSKVLSDTEFLNKLLVERPLDVLQALDELRALMNKVEKASSRESSNTETRQDCREIEMP
jgi:hypothetical protein